MKGSKEIRWAIIIQYIQMALSILIQLIYTPIMLKILGKTEYGIYSLASSIIMYLSLLSLGFGASYIKFYSIYKAKDDFEGIKKLNGLYLIVFTIIGLIAFAAGLTLVFNARMLLNDTYTNEDINIAKLLMLLLTINITISFPASVFVSYITSQEKFIFQKLLNIGKTVFAPAVSIILLYMGYGSVGMVLCTTCISLLIDIFNVLYCLLRLKMKFSFREPNFRLLKEVFVFSIFIAINQIIDQINWQTDKIILGKMAEAASGAVAIYTVGSNINNMYVSFSTAISSVFTPRIHRIVANASDTMDDELTRLFIKVGRIQFFVLCLILSGFIFFGEFFIRIWAGEGYEESYIICLLLIVPATISLIQNIGIEIQRAKNMHQFRSIAYLVMAIINVGISIWFCYMWGAIGCALGTTVSLIVANGFIMNIYYHKKIGLNIILFWKSIIKILPSLVIPIICGVLIMKYIEYHSIWEYGLYIICYSIIYILSIIFIGFNKEEKSILKSFFAKIRKKEKVIEK